MFTAAGDFEELIESFERGRGFESVANVILGFFAPPSGAQNDGRRIRWI